MAFLFSLASVLRVRETIEKREELELQRAQLEIARIRYRVDELTQELAKAGDARDEALQKSTQAFHLQNIQAEIKSAVDAKQTLCNTLETLNGLRDMQMRRYHAAHGDRQMLTDLMADQKEIWEQDELRTQQKGLDDIFAARSQRD